MKKYYAFLLLILMHAAADAQVLDTSGRWTWMGGNKSLGALTSGTFRTPGSTNSPRSRLQGTSIWCDKTGNVWLFGGSPGGSGINNTPLNDMWVFDRTAGTNGEWYWQGGPTPLHGSGAGIKGGSAGVDNIPKARQAAGRWVDKNGRLWLFGGFQIVGTAYTTYYVGNDLWTFDPDTKTWRWVTGDTSAGANRTGTYPAGRGMEGTPGGRCAMVTWTDTAGNLWLFGGSGVTTSTTAGVLADVWKFDISLEKWYYMGGPTTINAAVDYNGAASPGTPGGSPGGRQALAGWRDLNDYLYIFSGIGTAGSNSLLSDMWRYNPATNEWTWWRASAPNASYGTPGVASAANEPGRLYIMGTETDKYGKFWMFGGRFTPGSNNMQNSLWMYDPVINQWTQVNGYAGSDKKGVYGTKFTPDKDNQPGSRQSFLCYCESQNELWMFGGAGWDEASSSRGVLSDLWRFARVTPPSCTLTASITPSGAASFCPGDSVVLHANVVSGATYEWRDGTTVLPQTDDSLVVKTAGSYTVTLTDAICNVTSAPVAVQVHALPAADPQPSGTQPVCTGDTLMLRPAVTGMQYRWYRNGVQSGTDTVYYATQAGTYTLLVTNTTTGCHDSSSVATVVGLLPLPNAAITPSGARKICQGDSLELQAAFVGNATYAWRRDGTALPGSTTSSYKAGLPGFYSLSVTDGTTGCSDTSAAAAVLTVHARPVATVTPPGPVDACQGTGVQLTAAAGAGYVYEWKKDQQAAGTGNPYTAGTTGSYHVVVTDNNNCRDSSVPVQVQILPVPQFTVTPGDTAFCAGTAVRYEAQTSDTGLSYRWKKDGTDIPGATLPWYEAGADGVYGVVVGWRHIAGCSDSLEGIRITVHPLPVPSIEWDGITLHAGAGFAAYQWYEGGNILSGATDSLFAPADNGAYTVAVTDTNDCSNTSVVYNVNDVNGVTVIPAEGTALVYPNPVASGVIHIAYPSAVHLTISRIDGQVVLQERETRSADVSRLPAGIYLVRIESREGYLIGITRLVKTGR